MGKCKQCGREVSDASEFCYFCGSSTKDEKCGTGSVGNYEENSYRYGSQYSTRSVNYLCVFLLMFFILVT